MARCLIGCGSNLGKRREQLDRALELLRFMPGVSVEAVSRYRETRPVGGPAAQGSYLNAACVVETELGPHELLEALAAVEQTLLRRRTERWAARTIDLDLLLYDDVVLEDAGLTLPHPRMTTRRFVLEPCVEIAPDASHPVAGCTLRELLANISVPHPLVVIVGAPGSGAAEVAAAVTDATLARPLTAPARLPTGGEAAAWRETAGAWARALAGPAWDDDGHATVADFWLDGLPLVAAAHLDATALGGFEDDVRSVAAGTLVPNVAILLVAAPDVLEERLSRNAAAAGGTAVCQAAPGAVAAAVEVQSRLLRRLVCPGERSRRTPRAVVTVDARDPARAAAEATAVVEAML